MPIDIETPFVLSAIHTKARNLKTYTCFSGKDFEDIEADLLLHLWEAGLELPSERFAEPSLIIAILNRKGVDMLRHQMRKKELLHRDAKLLDAMIGVDEAGNPLTLMDALPACAPNIADEVAFQIDLANRLGSSGFVRPGAGALRRAPTPPRSDRNACPSADVV